jgi:4-alpha-glucanotransferase
MDKRGSGILLHITSLPSPYGIGDMGPEAYKFADFLAQARQSYWQILPLNPTDPLYGNSPYSSLSAFAGNTFLISPDLLVDDGLLSKKEIKPVPLFPQSKCDFKKVIRYKDTLLEKAFQRFSRKGKKQKAFKNFCRENSFWLDDFSLFMVLRKNFGRKLWNQWPPELRDRSLKSLRAFKKQWHTQIEQEKFRQYLFFHQWQSLKEYCNNKGVQLIGDIPIYVNMDSADAWTNSGLFKLDKEKNPSFVSGVPPDYFSKTGQLWNTPVYDWDAHKKTGYQWWIDRMAHNLKLFDLVRIDHFRGLVAYWEIQAGEKTAINGKWVKAPAKDFFSILIKQIPHLPIIAEDLGFITPDVRNLMKRFSLPGMKILQFAFTEDCLELSFLPHAFEKNCVAYTGTHDNNTVRGWFTQDASSKDRKSLYRYLGRNVSGKEIHWAMIRLALMSVAGIVILPMQDILGLGADARMNKPSIAFGNWEWRLSPGQITPGVSEHLLEITKTYGRS